jgi:uncharacterized surface protein with fasciclin (FAS1) repeats
MQSKLPSPNSNIAITLLVPTNGAWLRLMGGNALFLPSITSFGDDLPATVLYNTMLGSVSPEQVKSYTEDNKGSSPSIYGLLSGESGYNVQYWAAEKDGKTAYYFSSEVNEQVAETFRPVQVCNSWVYFTNTVLVPSQSGKLSDVSKVEIPEILPWSPKPDGNPDDSDGEVNPDPPVSLGTTPTGAEDSADGAAVARCQLPEQSAQAAEVSDNSSKTAMEAFSPSNVVPKKSQCETSFIDATRENGLTLLSTVASSIQDQLPDPSQPNTIFAPSDAAFTGMLSDLGLSISDALALGDKLTGVLLYHIHPDEALDASELGQQESLTTELGSRMADLSGYLIEVGAGPILTSKRGDTVEISNTVRVCDTIVHVVDKVLLPASTVEELPFVPSTSLSSPPVPDPDIIEYPSLNTTTYDGVVENGLAMGVGAFQRCTISLEAAGSIMNTMTDESGRFSFRKIPSCAISDGVLKLVSLNQTESCIDTSTNLGPAYDLMASLYTLIGVEGVPIPSPDAPLLLSPLSTLLSSPNLTESSLTTTSQATDDIAKTLGFDGTTSMTLGIDINDNTMGINSQSLVTALLLGTALQGLEGIELEKGVDAVNDFIAGNLRESLNLSNVETIEQILNATAVSPISSPQLGVIAGSVASLNDVLRTAWYDGLPAGDEGKRNVTSNVVQIAQTQISPAILELTKGGLSTEAFDAQFGPDSIRAAFPAEATSSIASGPITPARDDIVVQPASSAYKLDAVLWVSWMVLSIPYIYTLSANHLVVA